MPIITKIEAQKKNEDRVNIYLNEQFFMGIYKEIVFTLGLKKGMEITGTVRNVVDFGAFIDIGVHQDGLVHISEITDRYIKHPSEVLKVGDIVDVYVLSVDVAKKRISLSMKEIDK